MIDEAEDVAVADASAAAPPAPAPAAPAAPAPSSDLPALSLDSLIVTPDKMRSVQDDLVRIERARAATQAASAAEMTKRLDQDRDRLNRAYEATAKEPEGLESWDANAKSAQHYTDPVTAFGSAGSVFAMLASSFAGLPMEHALNAGAAAINAVHAGDEKAYNREYEAWQKNTNLALKRHEILRQNYNDALTLMNSNINAGRTKMELAARQFDDKKVLALLENGMTKELTDLMVSRNKAALELQNQWDKVQLEHDKVTDLRADPRYQNPATKAQAIADWTERWAPNGSQKLRYDFTKDYIESQKKANPNWTPDDLAKWRREAAEAEGDIDTSTGTGTPKTSKGLQAQEIKRRTEEYVAGGMSQTEAYNKASREVGLANSLPSGNKVDELRGKRDQVASIIEGSEKNLEFLRTYKGAAGIAGQIMRGGEIAGNIAGISTQSDRAQFRRRVYELQDMVPRILTDAAGRPLASAQKKVDQLVAGLNAGDTGPNTIRAYEELIEEMKKRKDNYTGRIETPFSRDEDRSGSSVAPADTAKPKPSGKNPWEKDPIVKPRADTGFGAEPLVG